MKKTLTFSVPIESPPRLVWDTMLSPDGYRAWAAAFMEGCYFSGSWEEGHKIQFLAPNGDGMTAVIAENRPFEYLSIRHLGEVKAGVEDTTSPEVMAWAPACENYAFESRDGITEVKVSLETLPEHEPFLQDAFPRALAILKTLCESRKEQTPGD